MKLYYQIKYQLSLSHFSRSRLRISKFTQTDIIRPVLLKKGTARKKGTEKKHRKNEHRKKGHKGKEMFLFSKLLLLLLNQHLNY